MARARSFLRIDRFTIETPTSSESRVRVIPRSARPDIPSVKRGYAHGEHRHAASGLSLPSM